MKLRNAIMFPVFALALGFSFPAHSQGVPVPVSVPVAVSQPAATSEPANRPAPNPQKEQAPQGADNKPPPGQNPSMREMAPNFSWPDINYDVKKLIGDMTREQLKAKGLEFRKKAIKQYCRDMAERYEEAT